MRAPRMNDNPAASIARRLASETIPASATTVTSRSWWAAMNAVIVGSMVVVSARLPSNASTISGNPVASVNKPDGDLRLEPAFLGEPRLAEPVTGVGLEVQRGHVVEHQRGRSQPGVGRARRGDPLPPLRLGVAGQPPVEGPIRRRLDADLAEHPQAVGLAGRLDDPGQHQVPEHRVPAGGLVEPEQLIRPAQPVPQMPHPRGHDRQRPRNRPSPATSPTGSTGVWLDGWR